MRCFPTRADAARTGLAALTLIALAQPGFAHHPGSHAKRAGAQVVLEVSHLATLSCTAIESVAPGAPPDAKPPAGSAAVLVRLARGPGDCGPAVRRLDAKAELALPEAKRLHLYFVMDGKLVSTERVDIR